MLVRHAKVICTLQYYIAIISLHLPVLCVVDEALYKTSINYNKFTCRLE